MDDETRQWLREVFASSDAPPRDIVPGRGLTREDLIAQNEAADTWREVTVPGEVILDVDGVPVGMTPATTETVYCGGTTVTTDQLHAVGLTPEDVPKLSIIEPPKHPRKDQQ